MAAIPACGPPGFAISCEKLVAQARLPAGRLILGGDHLGPHVWRKLPAEDAMRRAEEMIAQYVRAGFTKIHLDASMPCAGDPAILPDETVASRAARLAKIAEASCESGARAFLHHRHRSAGAGRRFARP